MMTTCPVAWKFETAYGADGVIAVLQDLVTRQILGRTMGRVTFHLSTLIEVERAKLAGEDSRSVSADGHEENQSFESATPANHDLRLANLESGCF